MNQETLSMVTHLVQCSCNGFSDNPKAIEKASVGSNDLFSQITCKAEDQTKNPMKWNSILKDLLSRCPQFCRDELVLPKIAHTTRWREGNSRKVLAPLGLKQNTENIIAGSLDMSRKRKADTNHWASAKRVKVDDSLKPCSVVVQRASLKVLRMKYKCCNNRPFVRLYDVHKEIPQVKQEEKPVFQNEFMGFLGLTSKDSSCIKQLQEIKTNHSVTLTSHPHIPISSDYGRRLFARKRHYLPQDVALRKIERTEWYLKGPATTGRRTQQPEITYGTRSKYSHTYKFPKRQYHQTHPSLQDTFNKYLCKPVCIHLEKVDLNSLLAKFKYTELKTIVVINDEPETVVINDEPETVVVSDEPETVVVSEELEIVVISDEPETIVIPDEPIEDDDIVLVSESVVPAARREVLATDCAMPSTDHGSDLQPQINRLSHIKPRRSLRLNNTS